MITVILIIVTLAVGTSTIIERVDTIEFDDLPACELAAGEISKRVSKAHTLITCVPKRTLV